MATVAPPPPDLRPLRIGEVLDVGIKVYTRNAKTLFKLVALVVIPVQVLGVLIIISTIPDALASTNQNPFQFTGDPATSSVPDFEVREFLIYIAGVMVVTILGFVATTISTGACFKAVSDAYLGSTPEWRSSLRYAMARVGSLLWVVFLVLLCTIAAMVAGVAVGVVPALALQNEVLVVIGIVLGLVVGLLLAAAIGVVLSLATPALLTEGLRGTKALRRSFELVRSRFWPVTAVVVVSYLIRTVLDSAIGGGVAALTFTDIGESVFLTQALSGAAGAIATIIATPFQAAVVAVLYFDLRVRREGFDLQLLAERIGVADPATAHAALLPPPIPTMPVYQPGVPSPPTYTPPPTHGLAIASLISGIFLCIGSIPAVIMGHMALGKIKRGQGAVEGKGLAIAGIVLGWVGTALLLLIVLGIVAASR